MEPITAKGEIYTEHQRTYALLVNVGGELHTHPYYMAEKVPGVIYPGTGLNLRVSISTQFTMSTEAI